MNVLIIKLSAQRMIYFNKFTHIFDLFNFKTSDTYSISNLIFIKLNQLYEFIAKKIVKICLNN